MNSRPYEARLLTVSFLNERTKHFEFGTLGATRLAFQPGQFISLNVEVNGHQYVRPYSIASAPRSDNRFALCLNIVPGGVVSRWLFNLEPGDTIRFTAPFGFFTLHQPLDPVSAFIATGTGIAPIRAMLQDLQRRPPAGPVWLIFGVRTEADILYRYEFEALAARLPDFRFIPTLSRPHLGWIGRTGYVQTQVERYLAGVRGLRAYICGLTKMVDDVRQRLRAMGYDRQALRYEKYG